MNRLRAPEKIAARPAVLPAGFAAYWNVLGETLSASRPALVGDFFAALPPGMVQTIDSLVAGGKQLRARMLCAVCEALGGKLRDALPRAMAVECIQAASLVHDDWVDGDRVRRNAPAAWTTHGARRAVLLADVIFATSLEQCAELGRHDVLVLSRAIAAIAAGACQEPLGADGGEANDLWRHDESPSYDRLIFLKTGALFAAAAELGAIAARANDAVRRAAYDYGALLGEAYQIADDLHDMVRTSVPARAMRNVGAVSLLLRRFGSVDGEIRHDEVLECLAGHSGQLERAMEREIAARRESALLVLNRVPSAYSRTVLAAIPGELLGTNRPARR